MPEPVRRLRMAAIDFLNPAPLMWDFEHEPGRSRLSRRYTIQYTTPANCARQLASGEADLGLVPAAAHAVTPGLLVAPGCAIASLDRVRSILLIVRAQPGIEGIRSVAADTSSRSSVAYARILFHRWWKREVEFRPHRPDLESMLAAADAALLIGDPALVALENSLAREERTGEPLLYFDLAHEWRAFTGLPWVAAFWALRAGALEAAGADAASLAADLQQSREHGLENVDTLVSEWSPRLALPAGVIRSYLTENIYYTLDGPCLESLERFYRYAAECGALPPAAPLSMLELGARAAGKGR